MLCPKCGAPIAKRDAFCTKCGTRCENGAEPVGPGRYCTKCGSPLVAETRFCTRCGAASISLNATEAKTSDSTKEVAMGALVGATSKTAPRAAGSARQSTSPILKLAVIALIFIVVAIGAISAAVSYTVHRVKEKVATIESTAKLDKNGTDLRSAASTAAKLAKSAGASTPNSATASADFADPAKFGSLSSPLSATGDQAKDWALKYERTVGGPEADLVVRTGDINNLGFGWPKGFDPFSGASTPPHPFPWTPPAVAPEGTKRILIGSAVQIEDAQTHVHDGYVSILISCFFTPGSCKPRQDSMPTPIAVSVGALPNKIDAVVFQLFLDDFQAPVWKSQFQVSINGTRIPNFESAINALDQSGPIGKLVTLKLLPEYWPLLQSGAVNLLIDDPTTHAGDGYAIDFVRILVNPHTFKYQVSLAASVVDADKHKPIADATVTAALQSAATDKLGKCQLDGLPAGLVVVNATAAGYDANSLPVDIAAGETRRAEIPLHRHDEGTAALERAIAQTGSATIYGIHFDTDSAKLRPDSTPALNSVLGLINSRPGSRWFIAGHTDNQGDVVRNQPLSEARATSVVTWLHAHGVSESQLTPQGFGATRPVADNATANGRALNRRVEIALAPAQQ